MKKFYTFCINQKIINYAKLPVFLCVYNIAAHAYADIYFNAKIAGPITNVARIDDQNKMHAVTPGNAQQDRSFSIGPNHLISFASNRAAKDGERVQRTMNIFLQEKVVNDKQPKGKQPKETLIQLSNSKHFSFTPKFSPNGKYLAYISRSKANLHHFYVYDVVKKEQKEIFSDKQIEDYMWSKDGKRILYSVANIYHSAIKVFELKTNTHRTIIESPIKSKEAETSNKEKLAYLISPVWSPDESKIAFIEHPLDKESSKLAKIYDTITQKISAISQPSHQVQIPLNWSHDGKAVAYSALVGFQTYYDEQLRDKVYKGGLHIFKANLLGKIEKLTDGDHYHGRPVFSPDDTKIAYLYAQKLGDQQTYRLNTMNQDGSNTTQLYNHVFREAFLTWK